MCYDSKARPPDPPAPRGRATGQDLVVTADDGNKYAAFLAQPEGVCTAQVLIYPDIRGLHRFYKDLAMRFAEVGISAMAIDYFGRSAGLTDRDDSFEYMPHVQQLTLPTFFADVQACLPALRQDAELPTFAMGFCIGGSFCLYTGTQDLPLAGIIPFYAGLGRKPANASETPVEVADRVKMPVLGLFGGADQGVPVELVEELDRQLDRAHVEHEIVIYPGAPHSFFDRRYDEHADASADAWRRVLSFIAAHRKPA
jgi:carboxymethylenebutenolidase